MDETIPALRALVAQTPDLHDYAVTNGSGGGEPDYLWLGKTGVVELEDVNQEVFEDQDTILARMGRLVRLAQAVPWLLSLVEEPATPVSPPELPDPPQPAERTAPEQLWALVGAYNALCDRQQAFNNFLRQGPITNGSQGWIEMFNTRENAFLGFCHTFEDIYPTIHEAFLGMQKATQGHAVESSYVPESPEEIDHATL